MKTQLKLFFKWGIKFESAYSVAEQAEQKVQYAGRVGLETEILKMFPQAAVPVEFERDREMSKKYEPKIQKRHSNQKKGLNFRLPYNDKIPIKFCFNRYLSLLKLAF